MKKIYFLVLIFFAMSIFNVTISHAAKHFIQSTFNANDEGWTGESTKETITYHHKGGNRGGYISIEDLYWGETAVTFPPSKFKGDLRRFDGGMISYDVKVLRQPTTKITPETWKDWGGFRINLNSSGYGATFTNYLAGLPNPPIPSDAHWTTYYVPMKARYWRVTDQDFATQSDWERVLSNVASLDISFDIGGQGILGVDNFKIVDSSKITTTPEPVSMFLFTMGGTALALLRRKKVS